MVRRGLRITPDHVAAYDAVCGFPVRSTVPITYLHVLAFPVQLALMADKEFPLPLPGLIHVSNEMTQYSPVPADGSVDATVWAADLRPHPKGVAVDLIGRIDHDGELAWLGRSTYLHRGKAAADPVAADPPVEPAPAAAGSPVARWRIPGDAGRRYARVSGDVNPIHLHPLTARLLGMPGAIAHGMWTHAHSLAALGPRLPDPARGAGLPTVRVDFHRPVRLPSTVEVYIPPTADSVVVTEAGRKERILLTTVVRSTSR